MIRQVQVPLYDLIASISDTVDLVSRLVANHHRQVAYIALNIGIELGMPLDQQNEMAMAGALHDIGSLYLRERIETLQFEDEGLFSHTEAGYFLLRPFQPLSRVADLVRFHHVPWRQGAGREDSGNRVPEGSHLLHLADRVAVLFNQEREVLGQVKGLVKRIQDCSGHIFKTDLVEAFVSLASKEYFWLSIASPALTKAFLSNRLNEATTLDRTAIKSLAELFSRIIDFRSPYTATHSHGVAAVSESLAGLVGFSVGECEMMGVAGYFHDLGKLAVPAEVLEKPAPLTAEEFNVVKGHPFFTYNVLKDVRDLDVVNKWASLHHERLDGAGYPFHLSGSDLPLGSQIMAVADVFTAVTEDRPYRKGMIQDEALRVLEKMSRSSALNGEIVNVLKRKYDEVDGLRRVAQKDVAKEYRELRRSLANLES